MTDKIRYFDRSLRPVSAAAVRLTQGNGCQHGPEHEEEEHYPENPFYRDIEMRQKIRIYRRHSNRNRDKVRDRYTSSGRRRSSCIRNAERAVFLFLFSVFILLTAVSSMFGSVLAYSESSGVVTAETSWTGTDFFSWPLAIDGRITSGYGMRTDPFTGEIKMHSGTDIAAPQGTPVLAAAAGTVISADMSDSWGGGYGYHVIIDHGEGITTLYGHCSVLCVSPGQYVQKGEMIARAGSTGNSTGDHLHFEISFDGIRQDPLLFFVSVSELDAGL